MVAAAGAERMTYRISKVDQNQREIVEALRAVGASVHPTHVVGGGFPDLAVGYRGQTFLLEVKMPGAELNEKERTWHDFWWGHVAVVRNVDEALAAIGAQQFSI